MRSSISAALLAATLHPALADPGEPYCVSRQVDAALARAVTTAEPGVEVEMPPHADVTFAFPKLGLNARINCFSDLATQDGDLRTEFSAGDGRFTAGQITLMSQISAIVYGSQAPGAADLFARCMAALPPKFDVLKRRRAFPVYGVGLRAACRIERRGPGADDDVATLEVTASAPREQVDRWIATNNGVGDPDRLAARDWSPFGAPVVDDDSSDPKGAYDDKRTAAILSHIQTAMKRNGGETYYGATRCDAARLFRAIAALRQAKDPLLDVSLFDDAMGFTTLFPSGARGLFVLECPKNKPPAVLWSLDGPPSQDGGEPAPRFDVGKTPAGVLAFIAKLVAADLRGEAQELSKAFRACLAAKDDRDFRAGQLQGRCVNGPGDAANTRLVLVSP